MTQTKPNGLPFLWISLLVIILDQVTKYLCVNLIEYGTAGMMAALVLCGTGDCNCSRFCLYLKKDAENS